MNIDPLADHPRFIEILAPEIARHWQSFLSTETVDSRTAKLQSHCRYEGLPMAWVAHDNGRVLGTAALRQHDLPGSEHLSPWLGGVFVMPEARRRGIGAALCAAVEQQAEAQFDISQLHLFTLGLQDWYRRQGWQYLDSCLWCGWNGHILFKNLGQQEVS